MPYPPWDSASAPPSLNQSNAPSSPRWLNNAKEAILKPWRRRSQRRQKKKAAKQASDTPYRQDEYLYNPNPFAPRPFAAGGGFPRFSTPFSADKPHINHPAAGGGLQPSRNGFADYASSPEPDLPKGYFEPEAALLYKPSRPALSNVFPMYDSPQLTPTPQRGTAGMRPTPEREMIPSPERNIEPGMRPTPEINLAPGMRPNIAGMRRHSTPIGPPLPQQEPRRPSRTSASSDISSERSNRRERRANMMRVIPNLPNKPQVRKESVYSRTPSHNEQYSSTHVSPVYPHQYSQPPHMPYSPNYPQQGRGLSNSFSFPPWPQPHEQLQELEKEIEEDQIDGEEDERWEMARRRDVHNKLQHIKEESDDDSDIRGFDSFMMY